MRTRRQDTRDMLMASGAVALLPLVAWLFRTRPLRADSVAAMQQTVRESRAKQISDEVSYHVDRYDTPDSAIEEKWAVVTALLEQQGAESDEAALVIKAARARLAGRTWPVFVERGVVGGEKVWVVTSSWLGEELNFFCGMTTPDEKLREEQKAIIRQTQVAVVSAEAPYRILR